MSAKLRKWADERMAMEARRELIVLLRCQGYLWVVIARALNMTPGEARRLHAMVMRRKRQGKP